MTTTTAQAIILWFRNDLRLDDNPALDRALHQGRPVIPIYLWAPSEEAGWAPGGASAWWLHHSLESLKAQLRARGSDLVVRRTDSSLEELRRLVAETGAVSVYWNRRYDPEIVRRDTAIKEALLADRLEARSFNGSLLFSPGKVENQSGKPFQVFTPFWKRCLTLPVRQPLDFSGGSLARPESFPDSDAIESLELLPRVDWAGGLRETWTPGEVGGRAALSRFVRDTAGTYKDERDFPGRQGTSRLSPYLHFGEISPVRVWHEVRRGNAGPSGESFLREVGWREFAAHLLFHFPDTVRNPLRPEFIRFPWDADARKLSIWQQGRTGYPIVDAGMRELWHTGWMHNRVRMIAGSFLVKDLLQPWQAGAKWFWDTLVDADLANNSLGWQWISGCGADAAPYFRIFNPVTQGRKFDPDGGYVRRWIPELRDVPLDYLHAPWEAPTDVLRSARVDLGRNYPEPCVDHGRARKRALEAYQSIRKPVS